ncbi:MAG: urea ABC transporter substrate-binding protein [Methylacidiphilales bacterium]|nr:urea ABC transporter substrate-binding protein [Candidatus Methylacidiphilales bacterium]
MPFADKTAFRWVVGILIVLFVAIASYLFHFWRIQQMPSIKVGILHSLTGTMSISERPVVDAVELSIDEINASGGLLGGRKVVPILADGHSDWPTFARESTRLIKDEKVCAVFGCWTSASRKTVRPIFEKLDGLLFYPVQYEGLEQSPNIIYLGAAPNQQIIPAVKWAFDNLGSRRFYLVGSDYVFPRAANAVISDQIKALGAQVVGEDYIPLGRTDVEPVVGRIVARHPDVILNTINGDTNVAFFRALRAAGISPKTVPTISFSIGESELPSMNPSTCVGDYAVWNYFQTLDGSRNNAFVTAFRKRYGADRVVSDPMEAAYCAVKLWAQAVEEAGTEETSAVRKTILDQSMAAPEGVMLIDPETQHTWRPVRVGRIRADGQFDVVWDSRRPVRPQPFPISRTAAEWEQFLDGLHTGWHGNWAAPTN